jgi:NADH-quinone oxidoreductase subunit C
MGLETPAGVTDGLPVTLKLLVENFPGDVGDVSVVLGEAKAVAAPEALVKIMAFLKNDARLLFNVLLDITAVDYRGREPRFEVVYHLLSLSFNSRLRITVKLPGDKPAVESVISLWGSADWLEREVFDMFGIGFAGHPNLKRILLYEEFEGHPLRKDYPIRKRQPLIGPKN